MLSLKKQSHSCPPPLTSIQSPATSLLSQQMGDLWPRLGGGRGKGHSPFSTVSELQTKETLTISRPCFPEMTGVGDGV